MENYFRKRSFLPAIALLGGLVLTACVNNDYEAHPINSGGSKKKILSLHHGKFNVRIFGKLHAAIQYIISFYSSKSRK